MIARLTRRQVAVNCIVAVLIWFGVPALLWWGIYLAVTS